MPVAIEAGRGGGQASPKPWNFFDVMFDVT